MAGKQTQGVMGLVTGLSLFLSMLQTADATMTVGQDQGDFVGSDQGAIQQAIDAAASQGGGQVVVRPGEYLLTNSDLLRDNVTLIGEGEVVFRKSAGVSASFTSDCGHGYNRVKVAQPERWQVGWGIALKDDTNSGGSNVAIRLGPEVTDFSQESNTVRGSADVMVGP